MKGPMRLGPEDIANESIDRIFTISIKGESALKELQNLLAQEKAITAIEKRIKDNRAALKTNTDGRLSPKAWIHWEKMNGYCFTTNRQ